MRVRHPNAASYRDLEPKQIYRIHENEKKRLYSRRVLDIEHGTFILLAFFCFISFDNIGEMDCFN